MRRSRSAAHLSFPGCKTLDSGLDHMEHPFLIQARASWLSLYGWSKLQAVCHRNSSTVSLTIVANWLPARWSPWFAFSAGIGYPDSCTSSRLEPCLVLLEIFNHYLLIQTSTDGRPDCERSSARPRRSRGPRSVHLSALSIPWLVSYSPEICQVWSRMRCD